MIGRILCWSRGVDVGIEWEAFLGGTYERWLRGQGLPVPGWAWLNAPAHVSREDLQTLARQRLLIGRDRWWRRARRLLAGAALEVGGVDLAGLQAEVLVPLELKLAERDRDLELTPARLAAWFWLAVDESRYGRRVDGCRGARGRGSQR